MPILGSTPDATDVATTRRPGWPEVGVAAGVYIALFLISPPLLRQLSGESDVSRGLLFAALSGIMGLAAFFAAYALRYRDWGVFGVRRVSAKWIWIAIGLGVLALIVARVVSAGVIAVTGDASADPQADYRAAADGGVVALVLQLVFLAVLTPIGEEFAFRGVLTNALTRYGAWISVPIGTAVFALAHGINLALIPAVVVGAVASILFVRTKSVWPGVIVHAVNNGVSTLLAVLLATAT